MRLRAAFDADRGQALVGVAADRGAADHRRDPDHRRRRRCGPRPRYRGPRGWCRWRPPGWTARSAPGPPPRWLPALPVRAWTPLRRSAGSTARAAPPGSGSTTPGSAGRPTAGCLAADVDAAGRLGIGHHDMGLDPVVGHRQQRRRPGCHRSHSARVTSESGYPASSIRVRIRWVAMSLSPRREPRSLCAVAGQFAGDRPGLVRPTPAALQVGGTGQRVHARVQVRADLQVVQPDVVGGVDDRGDLGGCPAVGRTPTAGHLPVRRRWRATARRPASRGSASPRAGTSRRRHHRPELRSSRLPILPDGWAAASPPADFAVPLPRRADPPTPYRLGPAESSSADNTDCR